MSRLSKKPIIIPEKTEVTISPENLVTIKGPLGELSRVFPSVVTFTKEGNEIMVSLKSDHRDFKALDGTAVAHVKNMLSGVNTLFQKKMLYEGVGFKADVKEGKLHLALGFSHPVILEIPKNLNVVTEKGSITVSGINKEDVGAFASKVRLHKVPEPYKGKGIRYSDEVIRRKQGKKSA